MRVLAVLVAAMAVTLLSCYLAVGTEIQAGSIPETAAETGGSVTTGITEYQEPFPGEYVTLP